jgi:para-aminobenzoate synthetase component I
VNQRSEAPSPVVVARALSRADAPGLLFFDSQRAPRASAARWSIITCAPRKVLTERDGRFVQLPGGQTVDDPISWLIENRAHTPGAAASGAAPFRGGLAGMLGFEFGWWIDRIDAQRSASPTPVLWVGDYPAALVYSHRDGSWQLTGDTDCRSAEFLGAALAQPAVDEAARPARGGGFKLTISAQEYRRRVARAVDAIWAGELFEVNYTERFCADWSGGGFSLYEKLRQTSTGAYCAYLDAGDFELASVSPEQFLAVDNGRIITRPIKGTRPRGATEAEDRQLAEELCASDKDRAENVMIVDLMRNDLTRVCRLGSVSATEICCLHSFEGVHHLVSTVEGELAEGFSAMDALLSAFPPGSISGAPKLRSIELIAELEETARGPYTGALFYWSSHGRLDSSVLIRTAVVCGGSAWYGAGGAVVADSDPGAEYDEACVKAAAFREVVTDE